MDKFWERYIQSRPAPGASKGAFDAFAAAHKEPRTMAQGGRIGFYKGKLATPNSPYFHTGKETYWVKFPTGTEVGKLDSRFEKTQVGTKEEIDALIKERDVVAKKTYKEGVGKSAIQKTAKAEKEYKEIIDSFIEKGDYENFKGEIYESQMKKKIGSGKKDKPKVVEFHSTL